MAKDMGYPVADQGLPAQPLLWVSYAGFLRATEEELRTPVSSEKRERLERGLAKLDNDFPNWLAEIAGDTADGITLRFRDLEATKNVASKLQDRGLRTE